MAMAEASVIEQRVAVTKPGRLHGGDGSIDCEILSLARWGAQVRLLGAVGAQRELFLSIDGFGQLSCRVTEVVGDIADLRFEGDAESQEAMFQDILDRVGDEEARRRYLRRSVLWPGTLSCCHRTFDCTILNMSLGGAKIALSDARDCAGSVTLLGDRFAGLPATVVWRRGRLVGLQFTCEPAEVARILGDLLPAITVSA